MEDILFFKFYILTKLASTNEYSVVIDDGNTKHRVALAMTIGEIRKACKCLPKVNAPLNILCLRLMTSSHDEASTWCKIPISVYPRDELGNV